MWLLHTRSTAQTRIYKLGPALDQFGRKYKHEIAQTINNHTGALVRLTPYGQNTCV